MLRALGVPAEHIPPRPEERTALYRSQLAKIGDLVLVIADNVSSEAQARPLLPGTWPHKVPVSSRHTLAGLGARLVDVTVLDQAASITLLETALRSLGPDALSALSPSEQQTPYLSEGRELRDSFHSANHELPAYLIVRD